MPTRFRPCIDLHGGKVKQIVGGSLTDDGAGLQTNHESDKPSSYFASLYRADALTGGHVIMLGPGNREAAVEALQAYPGGLQIGGGIDLENAHTFLEAGASHVVVTSFVFSSEGVFREDHLEKLSHHVGKNRLVVDLSCRRSDSGAWVVAMNRWQTPTNLDVSQESLERLSEYCDEFLIHAADVEGKQGGIDEPLVQRLGEWCPIPATYAGGASSLADLDTVDRLSGGRVDLTIGSALDIFGGSRICYADCVAFNRRPAG